MSFSWTCFIDETGDLQNEKANTSYGMGVYALPTSSILTVQNKLKEAKLDNIHFTNITSFDEKISTLKALATILNSTPCLLFGISTKDGAFTKDLKNNAEVGLVLEDKLPYKEVKGIFDKKIDVSRFQWAYKTTLYASLLAISIKHPKVWKINLKFSEVGDKKNSIRRNKFFQDNFNKLDSLVWDELKSGLNEKHSLKLKRPQVSFDFNLDSNEPLQGIADVASWISGRHLNNLDYNKFYNELSQYFGRFPEIIFKDLQKEKGIIVFDGIDY